jgi:hypothetical protein
VKKILFVLFTVALFAAWPEVGRADTIEDEADGIAAWKQDTGCKATPEEWWDQTTGVALTVFDTDTVEGTGDFSTQRVESVTVWAEVDGIRCSATCTTTTVCEPTGGLGDPYACWDVISCTQGGCYYEANNAPPEPPPGAVEIKDAADLVAAWKVETRCTETPEEWFTNLGTVTVFDLPGQAGAGDFDAQRVVHTCVKSRTGATFCSVCCTNTEVCDQVDNEPVCWEVVSCETPQCWTMDDDWPPP